VGGGHLPGPHFIEAYGDSPIGRLPGRLASGKPASKNKQFFFGHLSLASNFIPYRDLPSRARGLLVPKVPAYREILATDHSTGDVEGIVYSSRGENPSVEIVFDEFPHFLIQPDHSERKLSTLF